MFLDFWSDGWRSRYHNNKTYPLFVFKWKVYTDESWVWDNYIEQVVVYYMKFKFGGRLSSNWSWPLLDNELWALSSEYFVSSVLAGSANICYFIILANYICLYTSSTHFIWNLCSKGNHIAGKMDGKQFCGSRPCISPNLCSWVWCVYHIAFWEALFVPQYIDCN